MIAWYEESNRPIYMTAKDKKRDWKQAYLSITGLHPLKILSKPKKEKQPKVWETPVQSKLLSRAYYKQLKNKKPKSKDRFVDKPYKLGLIE